MNREDIHLLFAWRYPIPIQDIEALLPPKISFDESRKKEDKDEDKRDRVQPYHVDLMADCRERRDQRDQARAVSADCIEAIFEALYD